MKWEENVPPGAEKCGVPGQQQGGGEGEGEAVQLGAAEQEAVVEEEGRAPGDGGQQGDPGCLHHEVVEHLHSGGDPGDDDGEDIKTLANDDDDSENDES